VGESHDPVDVFREEAHELLQQFEESVVGLGDEPDNREFLDAAFRALHTIKGSGSMFDLTDLTEFAHDMETAFAALRDSGQSAPRRVVDLALEAVDHLERLIDGGASDPDRQNHAALVVDELRHLTGVDEEPASAAPPRTGAGDSPEVTTIRGTYVPSASTFLVGTNPISLISELGSLGALELSGSVAAIPGWAAFDPQACYLRWEFAVTGQVAPQDVGDVFMFIDADSRVELEGDDTDSATGRDSGAAIDSDAAITDGDSADRGTSDPATEGVADAPGSGSGGAATNPRGTGAQSIKVRTDRLDRMVNLVGEMVSLQAQITLRAEQLGDRLMAAHAEQLERLVREARGLSMDMHMVPVDRLFAPFRRHVRALAAELGREVSLEVSGTDTELDRNVVEQLRDPLLHIVRNAIDHGIEPPDRREAAGKRRAGHLRLLADYSGAMVRIRVSDDGAGLNRERIRARAVERGIVAEGDHLTEDEILDLIFAPGFSTAETATAVSGRGVGMDVVRRNVEALSGAVTVRSTPGRGSTVELRIPLTLAIVEGLLAQVGDQLFLIKLEYIRECIDGRAAVRGGRREMIDFRGEVVPTLDLADFFGIAGDRDDHRPIIVIEAGDQRVGLVVDSLLGNHQSVVKSLGRLLAGLEGVSGAVFLSDGTPGLMLDIERVVRRAIRRAS